MSFKYFRPTVRKVTTTQKAPAFKNTASAERFDDLLKASDILTNHNVGKHLAEVNFDDHSHSILKKSGLTGGHSILENSFSEKLSGRDSILGGAGKQNESQFGEDGARVAGEFGKGMAGSDGCPRILQTTYWAITLGVGFFSKKAAAAMGGAEATTGTVNETAEKLCKIGQDYADTKAKEKRDTAAEKVRNPQTTKPEQEQKQQEEHQKNIVDNKVQRPGPDDNGGGEGGFMTWKGQDQLSNGLKNAKDPITNPYNENQGVGELTATELQEMEADLRNAKDPATNWGDDTYNNFMGAVEMNVGQLSLKDTATNWGDNYSTATANVVDTVFTPQDVF
jgi:hypothetical protein